MSFGSRINFNLIGTSQKNDLNQYFTGKDLISFRGDDLLKKMHIETFEKTYSCDFGFLKHLQYHLAMHSIGASIAGGSVMSAVIGELDKASDIDIFPESLKDYHRAIGYLVDDTGWYHIADVDRDLLEKNPSAIKFIQLRPTERLFNEVDHALNKPIQLIKIAWFGNPKDLINAFDLRCVKFAMGSNGYIHWTELAMNDLENKVLTIANSFFSVSLCRRIKKYADRGFVLTDGTVGDMIRELGGSTMAAESAALIVEREEQIKDTGQANWENPQYRKDYYELDPLIFKRKWES